MTVGVLALQGAVSEHIAALQALGADAQDVRTPAELEGLSGLILPGGESTAIRKLLVREAMLDPLRQMVGAGLPVFGTCAGMVLLAQEDGLDALPAVVQRNGFGRQRDSFETALTVSGFTEPFHAVFIRAPYYESVGPDVKVLATVGETQRIVAASYRNVLVTAFHPELTGDLRFHQQFLNLIK